MYRNPHFHIVLPAVLDAAPQLLSRLEAGSVKACFLTMRAAEVWDWVRFRAWSWIQGLFRYIDVISSHHTPLTRAVGLQVD